jgi:electron transfer flavoprotein alpha/beta subunit
MRIAVFARPVQNPAIRIESGSTRVLEELPGYEPIPNPMDELALEVGLRLREKASLPVTITACSVGRGPSRKVLTEFLSCGVDEAVCIEEAGWEPDGAVVAARLSEYYRTSTFDLGLFGARDLDTDAGEVGPMFGALTGIPYIGSVVGVRWSGDRQIDVTRKQKRLREEIRVTLPACLGILRGDPLRYPSFWGKLEADASRIGTVCAGDVPREARLERKKFTRSKPKRGSVASAYAESSSVDRMRQALGIAGAGGGQKEDSFLKGDPEEVAERILKILKEEKVIEANSLPTERPVSTPICRHPRESGDP